METRVTFKFGDVSLEGLLDRGAGGPGVVIAHPHPLYGGDMNNPVVEHIARAYRSEGYTTLRFNFRGVGNSEGNYDEGIGEQQDIRSAVSYLTDIGYQTIDMAGYSFGAWVIARVGCAEAGSGRVVLVSPPVAFIDFKDIDPLPCLTLVVTGGQDEIAPAGMVKTMMPNWNPESHFQCIEHADHFYSGALTRLEETISNAF